MNFQSLAIWGGRALRVGMGVLALAAVGAADEFFGTALALSGEVSITRGIMEFEARVEERFLYDDEITTGEDGRVQLTFKSSFLSIGPKATVAIQKKVEGGREIISVHLEKGAFRSKILSLKPGEGYEVATESGSILVTGTDFVTAAEEGQKGMSVTVLEGKVNVLPSGGDGKPGGALPQSVGALQSGGLGPAGATSALRGITLAQVMDLKKQFPLPGDEEALPQPKALDLNAIDVQALRSQLLAALPQIPPVPIERAVIEQAASRAQEQLVREVIQNGNKIEEVLKFKIRFAIEAGVSNL